MLALALAFAATAAILGPLAATAIPQALGLPAVSAAGSIAVIALVILIAAAARSRKGPPASSLPKSAQGQ
jgi:hypothetical protein